jgi:alkylation response protein AidB-like acyl-CoA dehydrogenase
MYRLTDRQKALVVEASRIGTEEIAPHAAEVDARGRFPRESLAALAKGGYFGLTLPVAHGGQGEGLRVACAVLDEIAQRCGSTAMVYLMHLCGAACYTSHPGSDTALLREVASGRHLATLAWSEKGSRSHFWAPVSQAAVRNGTVELNAQKSWVTSAGEADGYVVSTQVAGAGGPTETALYLVRRTDPGVKVKGEWSGLGMRGNASAPMALEGCRIPVGRALCEPGKGFNRMMEILPWFNLGSAAVSVGIAEAATQIATGHLTGARLEHLGSRLSDLPNLRSRLARMRIETDRARAHLIAAVDSVESGSANAMLMVLEAKAAASDASVQVTDLGMNACGGAAFSRHLGLERCFRDARAAGIMAPTTDVLHDFIGRALCGMDLF